MSLPAVAAVQVSDLCCAWLCCWFTAVVLGTVGTMKYLRLLSQGLSSNFHRDYWASEATCWKMSGCVTSTQTICTTGCWLRVCLTLCATREYIIQFISLYINIIVNAGLIDGWKNKSISQKDDGFGKTNTFLKRHHLIILRCTDISHIYFPLDSFNTVIQSSYVNVHLYFISRKNKQTHSPSNGVSRVYRYLHRKFNCIIFVLSMQGLITNCVTNTNFFFLEYFLTINNSSVKTDVKFHTVWIYFTDVSREMATHLMVDTSNPKSKIRIWNANRSI